MDTLGHAAAAPSRSVLLSSRHYASRQSLVSTDVLPLVSNLVEINKPEAENLPYSLDSEKMEDEEGLVKAKAVNNMDAERDRRNLCLRFFSFVANNSVCLCLVFFFMVTCTVTLTRNSAESGRGVC
jgi:hypothetical protein